MVHCFIAACVVCVFLSCVILSQAIHEARQAEEKLAIVQEKFKVHQL